MKKNVGMTNLKKIEGTVQMNMVKARVAALTSEILGNTCRN